MTDKLPINELLNIELNEPKEIIIHVEKDEITEDQTKFDKDFEDARRNMLYIIDRAKEISEEVHLIARDKEGAREYEALNNLLRTIGDSSSVLIGLHEKRKKYKESKTKAEIEQHGTKINNAVFVGSSSELRDMLKKN